MAETIAVTCPKCKKAMSVPAALAGKKVRCKGCEAAVSVPAPKGKETFGLAEEPKAKPAKVVKKVEAPPPPPKPKGRFEEEEDDGRTDYGVTGQVDVGARCPFCAQDMDPPDARICKNCGYDLEERKRHDSKRVYQPTFGEYLSHHMLTILAGVVIIILIVANIISLMNMEDWFKGSWMETGDKNPQTNEPTYYINPGAGKLYIGLISLFMAAYAVRFMYRMFSRHLHPDERHVISR